MKIATVGDVHVKAKYDEKTAEYFQKIREKADILCLCGDLTDHGYPDEAATLVKYLQDFEIPVVAVLGNHDYDNDLQDEVLTVLEDGNIKMLQGNNFILEKVGFAGVKGFAGGFGKYAMPMFGESLNKKFVQESVDEALLLDQAMTSLQRNEQVEKIVAVMHYSPIAETVEGEPEQIYPFLGSSKLENVIDNRQAYVAFHGHAHLGKFEGKTARKNLVYNVSLPILQKKGMSPACFFYDL